MKNILFTLATIFLLTACSKATKKTLGLTEDMPDELQVSKAKPLEVPPHFNPTNPAVVRTQPATKAPSKLTKAEEAALKETAEK